MKRCGMLALLVLVFSLGAPAEALADDVAVAVRLTTPTGAQANDPYKRVLELRVTDGAATDVVVDRRLLELSVRAEGSRRRHRCRHPAAPRRTDAARVQRLGGGDASVGREWIDLRMYCWGRALRALEAGAQVEVTYGFRARGRGRWVARRPDESGALRRLTGEAVVFPAVITTESAEAARLRPTLRPASVRSGRSVSFRVRLRSAGQATWVYPRDDLWRFHVSGPLGEVDCEGQRQAIVPIIDFYRRATARSGPAASIAGSICEGAFEVAGVYEVTPIVDLVYDGHRYDLEAATGTFAGQSVPIRVTVGARGYVEQAVEQ